MVLLVTKTHGSCFLPVSAVHMVVPSPSWFSVPLQRELFLIILGLHFLFWQYLLVHVKRMIHIIVLGFSRERHPVDSVNVLVLYLIMVYYWLTWLWRMRAGGVFCDLLSIGRSPRKASCIILSRSGNLVTRVPGGCSRWDEVSQLKLMSRIEKARTNEFFLFLLHVLRASRAWLMPILPRKGIPPEFTASDGKITWKQPQRCINNRNLMIETIVYAKLTLMYYCHLSGK